MKVRAKLVGVEITSRYIILFNPPPCGIERSGISNRNPDGDEVPRGGPCWELQEAD